MLCYVMLCSELSCILREFARVDDMERSATQVESGSLFAATPSPPPSRWRQKAPDKWGSQNWQQAWKEAGAESTHDQFLFDRTQLWVKLLTGNADSRSYWADGKIPKKRGFPGSGRTELMACPGKPRLHTKIGTSSDGCDSWWPRRREEPCVAYFVGIGDEWVFARDAISHGCRVHAFDPTTRLRLRHERAAKAINTKRHRDQCSSCNASFHFAGLGGRKRASSLNSFGSINGSTLATLAELAAANPEADRSPKVLLIDIEGGEWAAFEQMGRDPEAMRILRGVELLYLDVHLSPTLTPPTLRQFVAAFELLYHRLRLKLRWLRTVNGYPSDQKVVDFLGSAGVPAGFCCYEMALVRE